MTSSWYDILAVLGSSKLTDILVPSWLDRSTSRAITYFGNIFLELDDGRGYLRVESVNNHGGLAWSQVSSIDLSEQTLDDDDPADVFVTSLTSLYFGEWTSVICLEVNYVTNEESQPDVGIVRCAELVVSGGQRIFIDPMWTFGVRIGVADAASVWMAEYKDGPWTMEHHHWARPLT